MATFIKIGRWGGIAIMAAATIVVWAILFPESMMEIIDGLTALLG